MPMDPSNSCIPILEGDCVGSDHSVVNHFYSAWQRELLRRSKDVPLEVVRISLNPKNHNPWLQDECTSTLHLFFTTDIQRTRKFMLTSFAYEDWGPMSPLETAIHTPAHLLQELTLSGQPMGLVVPPNLFNISTPSLQHIILTHCKFEWDSFLFKNGLIHLTVISPILHPTWSEMHQALGWMPNLRELRLLSALPATRAETLRSFTLSNLKHLLISSSDSVAVSNFLAQASFPPSTAVSLSSLDRGDKLIPLLVNPTTFYTRHPPPLYPGSPLFLGVHHVNSLTKLEINRSLDRTNPWFTLSFGQHKGYHNPEAQDYILSLLRLFPLEDVQSLHTQTYPDFAPQLLAACPTAIQITHVDIP